jgi:hypothetical protein
MNANVPDDDSIAAMPPTPAPTAADGLLSRHPKLAILLIAGVFYAILAGLALFVFVLLIRG